jgi:hypothetical protein
MPADTGSAGERHGGLLLPVLAILPPVQDSQREDQSHCEDGKRRPNPFHSRSPNLGPMASIAE